MNVDDEKILIHADVELQLFLDKWVIKVYDEEHTYSKFFLDTFPIPKDLGDVLTEFLETYYVKECNCDGNCDCEGE